MKLACDLMKRAERDAWTLMTNSEATLNPGFGCRVKGFTGLQAGPLKGTPAGYGGTVRTTRSSPKQLPI